MELFEDFYLISRKLRVYIYEYVCVVEILSTLGYVIYVKTL